MGAFRIEYRDGGLFLPDHGLWLDPHTPQTGPEPVFVSHAHSDHIAEHREVILSQPTSRLMQARMPGQRQEHVLGYGEELPIQIPGKEPFTISLFPAGHIFGSALGLVKAGGRRLLYTGDFKLRPSLSAETCEPQAADDLIMETTFGRPHYVFPPTEAVIQGVIRFCHEALDNDETPVLLGYSLGKSQELLCGLGGAGFPIMLHGTIYRLTRIYESFGRCFPKYERYESGSVKGKVLLCPPNVINSAMMRNLGKTRSAILTGWAVDPNCRYRYQCEAAFPLSDHADFPDLLEMVKRVGPTRVFTVHGFAAEFAQKLRNSGYQAQALSEEEQFTLGLVFSSTHEQKTQDQRKTNRVEQSRASQVAAASAVKVLPGADQDDEASPSFRKFAETCEAISHTSSKLEKIRLLAEFLRVLPTWAAGTAAVWFSGRPFPANQNRTLQLGWAVLRDALCRAARVDEFSFHQVYLKYSDLGETARELLGPQVHPGNLGMKEIAQGLEQISTARGPTGKRPLVYQLLAAASALEAKYLIKIITGDLRIGLKEGLVEEAIAAAYAQTAEAVRRAHLLVSDIGETARLAAAHRLAAATLVPFRPVRFMLASPEETATDVWTRMAGQGQANTDSEAVQKLSVWIEDKYDGIRCQVHKSGARAALYSRDLKDITSVFRELADAVAGLPEDFILDGEIVAMRGEEILPFSELQKRLGRREGDLFMREEVPIRLMAFDLLWAGGTSLLDVPLRERRARLEQLINGSESVKLAHLMTAGSPEEIEAAFTAARGRRNEGLMIKHPESAYTPGRRGLSWVKLKKAYATLDCVVVGAEYGHGKRSKVLSDYTFAVRDERTGELKNIGKAYSGLSDQEILQLTEHFLGAAVRQHGRYFEVRPEIVLEIACDKLQASDRHASGLAMRFPRILRIRTDKSPQDIDTLETARRIAASQNSGG